MMAHVRPEDVEAAIRTVALQTEEQVREAEDRVSFPQSEDPPIPEPDESEQYLPPDNAVLVYVDTHAQRIKLRLTLDGVRGRLLRRALVSFTMMPELTLEEVNILWEMIQPLAHEGEAVW